MLRSVFIATLCTGILVCCFENTGKSCITPKKNLGICVNIIECTRLKNLYNAALIHKTNLNFLHDSLCQKGGYEFCCDLNDFIPKRHECNTTNAEKETCVPIENCPEYNRIYQKSHATEKDTVLLANAFCHNQPIHIRVCCPKSKIRSRKRGRINDDKVLTIETDYLPMIGKCGFPSTHSRVAYGSDTDVGEFPWMAILVYERMMCQCAGVLINSKYILTAAHCIISKRTFRKCGNVIRVHLGVHDIRENTNTNNVHDSRVLNVDVEQIIPHPHFNEINLYNDIALIRLKKEVPTTVFISPVCLANFNFGTATNIKLRSVGWGTTHKGYLSTSKQTMKVDIPLVSQEKCKNLYKSLGYKIIDGQFCAGGSESKMNVCKGDSGGPILWFDKVNSVWFSVGIISFGTSNRCGKSKQLSVFTNITFYSDWITENIKP